MNVLNIEPSALHRVPTDLPRRPKARPIPIDLAAERAKDRAYRAGRRAPRISYARLTAAIAIGLVLGLSAGLPIAWQIDRALAPEWAE